MIRPLRRAHRRAWQAAALVLPLLLVFALLGRAPSRAGLSAPASASAGEIAWPGLPLTLSRVPSGVRVRSLGPLPAPDLLLYATKEPVGAERRLPAGATFLGSVSEGTQVLAAPPAEADRLVLYSLAHGAVVGSASLPPEAR
jgi:hypothetical protein